MASLLLILRYTAIQFTALIGLLFISGIALTLISRWTNNSFRQFRFPQAGLYLFGVIGVPLHELCHALFAKIFFHDIESIKWFDPKGKGGSYGTVVHYYNDRNLYHRIGLFFIGLGPVLLAPLFLYLAYHTLVPTAAGFSLTSMKASMVAVNFTRSLLAAKNWGSWGYYFFLYFAVCLTSQMELSPDDLKIARGGILPILLLLLVMNTAAALLNFNLHARFTQGFHGFLALWSACFVAALVISTLNLLICVIILNLGNRLFGKEAINPFQNN